MTPLVVVRGLTRAFAGRRAVDAVSFELARGETVAFLGPNGAGKSTTLKMMAGVLEPDEGEASIDGRSIVADRARAQASLGYLAEGAPLYGDLTPEEFLVFLGRARGLAGRAARAARARVAEETVIADVMGQPIETLSKGFRRRVALAGALLHDPPVLFLDEPTDGLDPNQKQTMRALVKRIGADKAILISTHQLDEVEAMCARAIVIAGGRLVADGPTQALLAPHGGLEAAFSALTAPPARASASASAPASPPASVGAGRER